MNLSPRVHFVHIVVVTGAAAAAATETVAVIPVTP